jgi:hypothetical protein
MVEHLRRVEQVLGHGERSVGITGQQNALGQLGGRLEVDRPDLVLQRQGGEP